jgi:PilZ domain
MHGVRSAIQSGEPASASLVSTKETCRRQSGSSLVELTIARVERRATNQRREDRHWGVVDRAMLVFRRKKLLVRVVNVSSSGIMIESDIIPRIGEQVSVAFEGFDRLHAIVRWVKQGRIGLDLGDGSIDLG